MISQIKKEARSLQKGKIHVTMLFALVYVLIFALAFVAFFLLERNGLVTGDNRKLLPAFFVAAFLPLVLAVKDGYKKFCFLQGEKETVEVKEAFEFLKPKSFFCLLRFSLTLFLLKALSLFVCLLPSGVFAALVFFLLMDGIVKEAFFFLCLTAALIFVLGLWFHFKVRRLLFLSEFFFFKNEKTSPLCAARKSILSMNKNTAKLAFLRLRFLLWFVFCLAVFPIVYVVGYYAQSMAVFARRIIEKAA